MFQRLLSLAKSKFSWQFKVAIFSSICKIVVLACNILIVRIISDSLGIDKYAIFTILINLVGWFLVGDLGIGSSMQNYISESRGIGVKYEKYVVNSLYIILPITLLLASFLYMMSPAIANVLLKQIYFIGTEEKVFYLRIVLLIYSLNFIINITSRLFFAEKKAQIINGWIAFSALISLCLMFFVKYFNVETKLLYALLVSVIPNIVVSSILLLSRFFKMSLLDFKFEIIICYDLIKRAYGFLGTSVLGVVSVNIDGIILANKMPPELVVVYAFCARIFSSIYNFYNQLLQASWPLFSEKLILGEKIYVKNKTNMYLKYGIIAMLLITLFLSFIINDLAHLILPKLDTKISVSIVLLFGVWYIVRLYSDTYGILLHVANKTRSINITGLCYLLVNVLSQLVLIPIIGLKGIILGAIIAYLFTSFWFFPIQARKIVA